MAISSPGIGSNIDVSGIVSKLVALERQPITQLDLREASYQAKLSAIGTLKGALSSLQGAAAALNSSARFRGFTATVSNSELFSASAATGATSGSYDVEVQTLATSNRLASTAFASADTVVGNGTLTLQFGTATPASVGPPATPASFAPNADRGIATITIDASNNTLAGIRKAINDANVGVTASIVNDGTGYRLTLSSTSTGAANSIKLTVEEGGLPADNTDTTGLSQLAYDPVAAAGSGKNMSETVAAQNATAILNGLTVTSATNTISSAIENVTLTLKKAAPGTTASLTVARDSASVRGAVDSFVKAYNDAAKTLKDLTAYNAATKTSGLLQGDTSVLALQGQLRTVLNSALPTTNGYRSLSEVGISFQRDGSLAVNSTKLQAAIDNPDKDLAALFATAGSVSDSTIEYTASTSSTRAGRYEVVVTQAATQGKATGDAAVGSLTIDASNDALSISVDGTAVSISLTRKTYASLAELVTELQQRVNGASSLSNAGIGVSVSESGGILTVTSSAYGADSKVSVSGGNGAANLFGTTTSTDGVDVEGTIDGKAATGAGQQLTAQSGDATGLIITTTGSGTGSLGWVEFSEGFGALLNRSLTDMLGSSGNLASRIDGINATIKEIGTRRVAIDKRASAAEKRYLAQYNALDALMSSMLSTSQFLQQQLSALSFNQK